VIENTVKKILQSKLLLLLEKIIARLNSYYKKSSNLLVWLKYILKYHSGYLIKVPGMAEKLAPLISMFKRRTENFDKVYKLKGKLDMLLSIDDDQKKQKSKSKLDIHYNPQVIYEEGDAVLQISEKQKITRIPSIIKKKDHKKAQAQDERQFSDSVSDSDEDINQNFDTYLNAHAEIGASEDIVSEEEEDYIDLE